MVCGIPRHHRCRPQCLCSTTTTIFQPRLNTPTPSNNSNCRIPRVSTTVVVPRLTRVHQRHSRARPVARALRDAVTSHVMVRSLGPPLEEHRTDFHRTHPQRHPSSRVRLPQLWQAVHSALCSDCSPTCPHWREASYVRAMWKGMLLPCLKSSYLT